MRYILVLIVFLLGSALVFGQCQKYEALDKLLEKNQYQKAVEKADEIAKKEKSAAYPYYFQAKVNFIQFQQNAQFIYLTASLNAVNRAINRDKQKKCWLDFESDLANIRTKSSFVADSLMLAGDQKQGLFYCEQVAIIFGDTTNQYMLYLKKSFAEEQLVQLQGTNQAAIDFSKIPADELKNINLIDANGLKTGHWIKFFPNGNMAYHVVFNNGKPIGEYYRYHENGARMAYLFYYENGFAEASLFNEDTSLLATGYYWGINKDSIWTYFYQDKTIAAQISFRMGLENGRAKVFYQDGTLLEELDWEIGKKNGIWRQFYPNGNKRLETKFLNNQKQGPFIMYHDNNAYDMKGSYNNGLRDGTWQFFDQSGKLLSTLVYSMGKLPIEVELDKLTNELNSQTILYESAKKQNKSVEEIRKLNSSMESLKKKILELEAKSPQEIETKELRYLDEPLPASEDPMNYLNNPLEFINKNK